MRKYDKQWHQEDIQDELNEYRNESHFIKRWSELSDVVYTYTRAGWSGHQLDYPLPKWSYFVGLIYMYPKYTGRWLFFRRAGKKAGAAKVIREVRNPKKLSKLDEIAKRNNIDPKLFRQICNRQLKYWILLP